MGIDDEDSLAIAEVYLAQTCCAPLAKLSTADLSAEYQRDKAGDEEFRLAEGYSTLLQRYSTGMPIRLSDPVASVTRHNGGVTIRTSDTTYSARAAIVTVSVKLLQERTIHFSPPLSAEKQAALDAMEMPAATKLVYVFDEPRWDASMLYLLHTGTCARWWTRGNVITCFATAERAEALDGMPEAEALSLGLSELCALLGDEALRAHVQSMARVSWAKDQFVRGGCACPSSVSPVGVADAICARTCEGAINAPPLIIAARFAGMRT
jgi:monoamine oxidase